MGISDLREFRHFLTGLQLHVSLLPVGPVTAEAASAPELSGLVRRPHCLHLDLKQLLYGGPDHDFVGARIDVETESPLGLFLCDALLRHQGPPNNVVGVHHANASESFRAAVSDISTRSWPSRS